MATKPENTDDALQVASGKLEDLQDVGIDAESIEKMRLDQAAMAQWLRDQPTIDVFLLRSVFGDVAKMTYNGIAFATPTMKQVSVPAPIGEAYLRRQEADIAQEAAARAAGGQK